MDFPNGESGVPAAPRSAGFRRKDVFQLADYLVEHDISRDIYLSAPFSTVAVGKSEHRQRKKKVLFFDVKSNESKETRETRRERKREIDIDRGKERERERRRERESKA